MHPLFAESLIHPSLRFFLACDRLLSVACLLSFACWKMAGMRPDKQEYRECFANKEVKKKFDWWFYWDLNHLLCGALFEYLYCRSNFPFIYFEKKKFTKKRNSLVFVSTLTGKKKEKEIGSISKKKKWDIVVNTFTNVNDVLLRSYFYY